jgi:hypothetical protein
MPVSGLESSSTSRPSLYKVSSSSQYRIGAALGGFFVVHAVQRFASKIGFTAAAAGPTAHYSCIAHAFSPSLNLYSE